MQKTIIKRIGNQTYSFNVEVNSNLELHYKQQRLGFGEVNKCECCNSQNLELNDNPFNSICRYLFILCKDCRAKLNLEEDKFNKEILVVKGGWVK